MTDQTTRSGTRRRARLRNRWVKGAASIVAAAVAIGVAAVATAPAMAATGGVGYGSFDDSPMSPYKGTFIQDNLRIICAESGRPLPKGNSLAAPEIVGLAQIAALSSSRGEHPGISENQLAGINRVLNEHVNTSDPAEAAGLEYAVASVLYPNDSRYSIDGQQWGSIDEVINQDMYSPAGGGAGVSAIQSWTHSIINDINSTVAGGNATGSGTLSFTIDLGLVPPTGTVEMDGTPGSTGSIDLVNAVFSNGSTHMDGVTEGQVLDVVAVPPADGSQYQVSGSGTFTPPGGGGWLPQVTLLRAIADVQSSIGAAGQGSSTPFGVDGFDPSWISQTFNPVLTTQAVQFVERGDKPTDVLTFSAAAGEDGVVRPWTQSRTGNYAPILAQGTLYGPFASEPAQSPDVPAGAPVAGHATVTTSQSDGPNVPYTVTSDTAVTATGYYTWVWEINAADQTDSVKLALPKDYTWRDAFGQKVETSLTPMYPALTSKVNEKIVTVGQKTTDHLTITNTGGDWLTGVSAKFTGRAYSIETGAAPSTGDSVPAGLSPFATVEVTVDKPGEIDSPSVTVPANAGRIVWVWSFDAADQADPSKFGAGYTWQDQWGLEAETSLVQFKPVIISKVSSAVVQVGDKLNDTLTTSVVEGQWIDGTNVVANGTLYGPLTKPATTSATVPSGTPVAGTASLGLTGIGTFETNTDIVATATGYYVWVWSIEQSAQSGSAAQLLPKGYKFVDQYGLKDETSVVPMRPELTSKVNEETVVAWQKVTDHLTVRNAGGEWLTGIAAKFSGTAYSVTSGDAPVTGDAIPADAVPIATVEITVTKEGEIDSPSITVPADAGYVVWVWSFNAADQADPSLFGAGYTWQDKWALKDETSVAQFKPVVTTQVSSKIVQLGDEINDVVTTSVVQGQWIKGTKVTASGTLYGPFLAQPDQSSTVPSWAPIAGTAELTFDGVQKRETKSGITATESGFYTWVWEIHQDKQKGRAAELIPDGYSFVDDFAQVPETSITPSGIIAESAVTKSEVALGEKIQDTLFVRLNGDGGWLQSGRERIPVVFRGTAYWIAGDKAPAVSDTVPEAAEAIGTTFITADRPGEYKSELIDGEDYRAGHISWVWEIREEDQPEAVRGMVAEWHDAFGLPNETQRILMPKVTTKADQTGYIGVGFQDTAKVTGTLPVTGADLHFELYAATKNENDEWICEAGNLLWTSETTHVETTGEYVSGVGPGLAPGEYHWVEVLTSTNGNEISRGICGLPDETTKVVPPKVTTKAQTNVAVGDPFTDTAVIEGKLPATEDQAFNLHFELYAATKNEDGQWICEAGNLLWTSETQKVWGTTLEYTSPEAPGQREGEYHWVEVLTAPQLDGAEIHRGVCGLPDETTTVVAPTVSTKSQAGVKLGGTFNDTAIVEGLLPSNGVELTFEAYKVPMKDDGTGKWVVATPEADAEGNPIEPGDLSWVCTAENRVFSNVGDGEIVTKAGEYVGPDAIAETHGKYLWVESLYTVPRNEGDEAMLITSGKCGLLNETTFAVDVTTKAHTSDGTGTAAFGEELWDTAELTGYVPEGGSVEFEVYQTKKGMAPVCDADTLMTTLKSAEGQPLAGGLYTKDAPLAVVSEHMKNEVDYDSDVFFVEVTKDSSGREVSRGECGDVDETVAANAAVAAVAATGGPIAGVIAGGAAIALLAGLGALLLIRRRRSVGSVTAE